MIENPQNVADQGQASAVLDESKKLAQELETIGKDTTTQDVDYLAHIRKVVQGKSLHTVEDGILKCVWQNIEKRVETLWGEYKAALLSEGESMAQSSRHSPDIQNRLLKQSLKVLKLVYLGTSTPKIEPPFMKVLIEIIRLSTSFPVIQKVIQLVQSMAAAPFRVIDAIQSNYLTLFMYGFYLFQHNNLYNITTTNFAALLVDDPFFERLQQTTTNPELYLGLSTEMLQQPFHFFVSNANLTLKLAGTVRDEADGNVLVNPFARHQLMQIPIEISNLEKKYPNLNFYQVTKAIIKEYSLPLEENTLLFDALLFRVRGHLMSTTLKDRHNFFGVVLEGLSLLGSLRLLKNTPYSSGAQGTLFQQFFSENVKAYELFLELFDLFFLKLTPKLHKSILSTTLRLYSLLSDSRTSDVIAQVTETNGIIYKIFKETLLVRLEKHGDSYQPHTATGSLPNETVLSPFLLRDLSPWVDQALAHHMRSGNEDGFVTPLTPLLSLMFTALNFHNSDGYLTHSYEGLIALFKIVLKVVRSGKVCTQFNVIDKSVEVMKNFFTCFIAKTKFLSQEEGKWLELDNKQLAVVIAYLFQILNVNSFYITQREPRVRFGTTLARKIVDSDLFPMMERIMCELPAYEVFRDEKNRTDFIIRVADSMSHVGFAAPGLIGKLIDGQLAVTLCGEIQAMKNVSSDDLPSFLLFLNFLILKEEGYAMAEKFILFKKVLDLCFDDEKFREISENDMLMKRITPHICDLFKNNKLEKTVRGAVMKKISDVIAMGDGLTKKLLDFIVDTGPVKEAEAMQIENPQKLQRDLEDLVFKAHQALDQTARFFVKIDRNGQHLRKSITEAEIDKLFHLLRLIVTLSFDMGDVGSLNDINYWMRYFHRVLEQPPSRFAKKITQKILTELNNIEQMFSGRTLEQLADFSAVWSSDLCFHAASGNLIEILVQKKVKSPNAIHLRSTINYIQLLLDLLKEAGEAGLDLRDGIEKEDLKVLVFRMLELKRVSLHQLARDRSFTIAKFDLDIVEVHKKDDLTMDQKQEKERELRKKSSDSLKLYEKSHIFNEINGRVTNLLQQVYTKQPVFEPKDVQKQMEKFFTSCAQFVTYDLKPDENFMENAHRTLIINELSIQHHHQIVQLFYGRQKPCQFVLTYHSLGRYEQYRLLLLWFFGVVTQVSKCRKSANAGKSEEEQKTQTLVDLDFDELVKSFVDRNVSALSDRSLQLMYNISEVSVEPKQKVMIRSKELDSVNDIQAHLSGIHVSILENLTDILKKVNSIDDCPVILKENQHLRRLRDYVLETIESISPLKVKEVQGNPYMQRQNRRNPWMEYGDETQRQQMLQDARGILMGMGYSQRASDRALENADIPDAHAAIEWLAQHAEEIALEESLFAEEQAMAAAITKSRPAMPTIDEESIFGDPPAKKDPQPLNSEQYTIQLHRFFNQTIGFFLDNLFSFEGSELRVSNIVKKFLTKIANLPNEAGKSSSIADYAKPEGNAENLLKKCFAHLSKLLDERYQAILPKVHGKKAEPAQTQPSQQTPITAAGGAQKKKSRGKKFGGMEIEIPLEELEKSIQQFNILMPLMMFVLGESAKKESPKELVEFTEEYIRLLQYLVNFERILAKSAGNEKKLQSLRGKLENYFQISFSIMYQIVNGIETQVSKADEKEKPAQNEEEEKRAGHAIKDLIGDVISWFKRKEGGRESELTTKLTRSFVTIITTYLQNANLTWRKSKVNVMSREILRLVLDILPRLFRIRPETALKFIKNHGLRELLSLRSSDLRFDGLLHVFWKLIDTLVRDANLINATIETEIKHVFYSELGNVAPLPQAEGVQQVSYPRRAIRFEQLKNCLQPSLQTRFPDQFTAVCEKIGSLEQQIDIVPVDKKEPEKKPAAEDKSVEKLAKRALERRSSIEGKADEKGEKKKTGESANADLSKLYLTLHPNVSYAKLHSLANKVPKVMSARSKLARSDTRSKGGKSSNAGEEAMQIEGDYVISSLDFVPSELAQIVIEFLVKNVVHSVNGALSIHASEGQQANEAPPVFSIDLIINSLDLLLMNYPILTNLVLKQSCTRSVKKTLKNDYLLSKLGQVQNVTFLKYFLKIVLPTTFEKFRNFLLRICLDNALLYESTTTVKSKDNMSQATMKTITHPYAYEVRKKVCHEISNMLEAITTQEKNFLNDEDSIRTLSAVGATLVFILPLKEVTRLCIKSDENPTSINLIRVYADALKAFNFADFYVLEETLPFILEPMSMLLQYSFLALKKIGVSAGIGLLANRNAVMPRLPFKDGKFVEEWKELNEALNVNDVRGPEPLDVYLDIQEELSDGGDEEAPLDQLEDGEDEEEQGEGGDEEDIEQMVEQVERRIRRTVPGDHMRPSAIIEESAPDLGDEDIYHLGQPPAQPIYVAQERISQSSEEEVFVDAAEPPQRGDQAEKPILLPTGGPEASDDVALGEENDEDEGESLPGEEESDEEFDILEEGKKEIQLIQQILTEKSVYKSSRDNNTHVQWTIKTFSKESNQYVEDPVLMQINTTFNQFITKLHKSYAALGNVKETAINAKTFSLIAKLNDDIKQNLKIYDGEPAMIKWDEMMRSQTRAAEPSNATVISTTQAREPLERSAWMRGPGDPSRIPEDLERLLGLVRPDRQLIGRDDEQEGDPTDLYRVLIRGHEAPGSVFRGGNYANATNQREQEAERRLLAAPDIAQNLNRLAQALIARHPPAAYIPPQPPTSATISLTEPMRIEASLPEPPHVAPSSPRTIVIDTTAALPVIAPPPAQIAPQQQTMEVEPSRVEPQPPAPTSPRAAAPPQAPVPQNPFEQPAQSIAAPVNPDDLIALPAPVPVPAPGPEQAAPVDNLPAPPPAAGGQSTSSINFVDLGLPADFLERNNINREFFENLSEELKMEIMLQHLPDSAGGNNVGTSTNPANPTQSNAMGNAVGAPSAISQEFLEALPENIRREVLEQEAANQRAAARNVNPAEEFSVFVASLTPDLREEVFLTADQAMIAQLPAELRREAERLRQRQHTRAAGFDPNLGGRYFYERQNALGKAAKLSKPTKKIDVADLTKDRQLLMKLYQADDKFLESMIKLVYFNNSSFTRFPFSLLKALCLNSSNEYRIIDCLLFLLKHRDLPRMLQSVKTEGFPMLNLNMQEKVVTLYEDVYREVSLRILHILDKYTEGNPHFVLEALTQTEQQQQQSQMEESKDAPERRGDKSKTRKPLAILASIRAENRLVNDATNSPLVELIQLLGDEKFWNTHSQHLSLLISAIHNVLKKIRNVLRREESGEELISGSKEAEFTDTTQLKLEPGCVKLICGVLCVPNVDEATLSKLSTIVSIFCIEPSNLEYFIKELKFLLSVLSSRMNAEMHQNIEKMRAFSRSSQFAAMKEDDRVHRLMSETNLLSDMKLENEKRLFRIVNAIKEIFERAYAEKVKENKKQQQLEAQQRQQAQAEAAKASGQPVPPLAPGKIEEEKAAPTEAPKMQRVPSKREESESELLKRAREHITRSFQDLLLDAELNRFWVNVIDLVGILGDSFASVLTLHSPIFHRLQPILESFLIIYKTFTEDEAEAGLMKKGIAPQEATRDEKGNRKPSFSISSIAKVENSSDPLDKEQLANIQNLKLEINDLFKVMCLRNRKIINLMVKQNLSLLNDSLNIIVRKMPQVLDFDNKCAYFRQEIEKMRRGDHQFNHGIELHVTRNHIFQDSFAQLSGKKGPELKGRFRITFNDEEGLDAGGLLREWYLLLSREMFNPNYALFRTNVNGVTFIPSRDSNVNPNHLDYFRFIGRIVSKALFDNEKLDAYFTRSFYKHILGQPLSYHDMEDIDPGYYKNLKWILENDISAMDMTFSYEEELFGVRNTIDLIANGRNIPVTEENKQDYVREICYAKMAKQIKSQIEAFLEGFHEIIPPQLVSIFDSKELELMISGTPDIDIQDLKENTEYHQYTKDSQVIRWMWELLETFDLQAKASFVQFVTGTSKVPLEGFKALRGIGGVSKFSIHRSYNINHLPTAHTCFNQLDLPEYPTKDMLAEKLLLAINEGKEGFHGFR